jgi:hypothetical protein
LNFARQKENTPLIAPKPMFGSFDDTLMVMPDDVILEFVRPVFNTGMVDTKRTNFMEPATAAGDDVHDKYKDYFLYSKNNL